MFGALPGSDVRKTFMDLIAEATRCGNFSFSFVEIFCVRSIGSNVAGCWIHEANEKVKCFSRKYFYFSLFNTAASKHTGVGYNPVFEFDVGCSRDFRALPVLFRCLIDSLYQGLSKAECPETKVDFC